MITVYHSAAPVFTFLLVNTYTGSIVPFYINSSFWTSITIGNINTSPELVGAYIGTYDEFVTLYPEYCL